MNQSGVYTPLLSWDLYAMYILDRAKVSAMRNDLTFLQERAKKETWNFDFNRALSSSYDAIVLTDAKQVIQWVNKGFTQMTGYDKKAVLGQQPKFLQGKETSTKTTQRIRTQLHEKKPLSETILNYRKCGEPYLCRVNIYPLKNQESEVTHFLAVEQELPRVA